VTVRKSKQPFHFQIEKVLIVIKGPQTRLFLSEMEEISSRIMFVSSVPWRERPAFNAVVFSKYIALAIYLTNFPMM